MRGVLRRVLYCARIKHSPCSRRQQRFRSISSSAHRPKANAKSKLPLYTCTHQQQHQSNLCMYTRKHTHNLRHTSPKPFADGGQLTWISRIYVYTLWNGGILVAAAADAETPPPFRERLRSHTHTHSHTHFRFKWFACCAMRSVPQLSLGCKLRVFGERALCIQIKWRTRATDARVKNVHIKYPRCSSTHWNRLP